MSPAARIRSTVIPSLAERFGGTPDAWTLKKSYSKRAKGSANRVFFAKNRESGLAVAVKANVLKDANERNFRALVNLRRVVPDSVRPFFIAEDRSFFVMEWVDAPLLIDKMRGPARRAALGRAGAWLARLHDVTGTGRAVEEQLKTLPLPAVKANRSDEISRVCAVLEHRYWALKGRTAPCAMLHGDYQLHNLFDQGDRVLGFDRPRDRTGAVYFDLARFCVGIRLYRDLDGARGKIWPDDAMTDRRWFLDGYGERPEEDAALASFVEDLVLFRRWRHFHVRAEKSRTCRERAALTRVQLVERRLLKP